MVGDSFSCLNGFVDSVKAVSRWEKMAGDQMPWICSDGTMKLSEEIVYTVMFIQTERNWKTAAPGEKDLERHLDMFQTCAFLIISTSYT